MLKTIANRYAKRAAARRKAIRHRAAIWKQRARRALTLMAVAGGMMGAGVAHAQMGGVGGMGAAGGFGQGAMAPTGGLVNRAVTQLQDLEANGPGWLYYGLNAADRGLGYQGSYMTLGGFIPYAEDDLGGLWSADLRSHLSEYGGFFSNVGAVRKQFIGGTILGVGVFWDYDGDMGMYPATTPYGSAFGHTYNQVGISGEWLTDYGNIRSNGYIPVGTTAYTVGNPGTPFYENFIMCQYGLDAALAGADLEVGAYIPGLSDWAGMISVGGYTFGNERYNWSRGPRAGQDVVPFFGGVYTRLDLTLIRNWDFSLQYNNDSYFDSTGFARLTYRMGGSRRRNVPDQMEQPMMRNEHIVRAHQEPIFSGNPANGGQAWYVIHVDNSAPAGGDGTYERPFNTLAAGNAAATGDYDMVFVNRGTGTSTGYDTAFTPLASNQYLIGNGRSFVIDTTCGLRDIATLVNGTAPLLSNPAGTSIVANNGLIANNFTIQNSAVAIQGTGSLSGFGRPGTSPFGPTTQADYAAGAAMVSNVVMDGQGNPGRRGVFLDTANGAINISNSTIQGMTNGAFVVNKGNPNATFQGTITGTTSSNSVLIQETTGGTFNLAVGAAPNGNTPNAINDIGGLGIQIGGAAPTTVTAVNIGNATLTNNPTAVTVQNTTGPITFTDSKIKDPSATGAAIAVDGGTPVLTYGPSNTIEITGTGSGGQLLDVRNTLVGSKVSLTGATQASISAAGTRGIVVDNAGGDVEVTNATIKAASGGVTVVNSAGNQTFTNVAVTGTAGTAAVSLANNSGVTKLTNVDISSTGVVGLLGTNLTQLDVSGGSSIATTGRAAISLDNVNAVNAAFDTVTSATSTGHGLSITNSNAGGGTGVAIGSTTITNAALNGINLVNNLPQGGGAGVLLTSVSTTITDTAAGGGLAGIFVQNTNASFTNATITGWENGLRAVAPGAADSTIVFLANSTVTDASGPAILLNASGGTVNATIKDNAALSSVQGGGAGTTVVSGQVGTGTLNLDLSGNTIAPATTPANTVVLDNIGGTLGVSQTAAVPPPTIEQVISGANNSPGTVIVTTSGVITEGVPPLTP
jgi:hypothetical protein